MRTKRALIAREQLERNRLHTRVMLHNANAEEGAGGEKKTLGAQQCDVAHFQAITFPRCQQL